MKLICYGKIETATVTAFHTPQLIPAKETVKKLINKIKPGEIITEIQLTSNKDISQ